MKVLLNLLPEEGRELIRRKYHNRFFLWQTALLFLAEIFYIALLVGVLLMLRMNYAHVEEAADNRIRTQADSRALGGYETKFQEVNRLAAQSLNFSRRHLEWADLFVHLGTLIPENVTLTSLLTKDYTISLSGVAKTRDDLLLFERNIKEDECFASFNLPVSNLFSQENVDFQMDFSVKDTCLKMKL